jgi:hypothetical protein
MTQVSLLKNYEYRTLDPSGTSWPAVHVHGDDEICDVGRADERRLASGLADMVHTFHRDMRDTGRHRFDRALADRHQARANAAGGKPADRDHGRGNGDIRDDVDPYRDRAVRCRAPIDSRCMGQVAIIPTQVEHRSESNNYLKCVSSNDRTRGDGINSIASSVLGRNS